MEKWGLGWEDLKKVNPRLVMLRISGYGQGGPYSDRPGFGMIAEAMSGVAYRTGYPDGPPIFSSLPLADYTTGLFGAFSTMFAIYNRDHGTGNGEMIDLALFEPLFRMMEDQVIAHDQLGAVFGRMGIRSTMSAPRGIFATKDDKWIVISAVTDATAFRLMRTVGGTELELDPRFATNASRIEHVDALEGAITDWIKARTQEEVLETFRKHDVVASGVYDIKQIFSDMQYQYRQNIVSVEDPELGPVRVPAVLPKFLNTPGAIDHLSVPLGSNTDEVLRNLGLAAAEIDKLRGDGVI
jgi:crotonobetainyl-CoA:carnitine CoA-transferase CaiB-like acyl-CoA transferase